MSELKPCPFCGGEPVFHEASQISETWFVASVNCRSCCAQVVSRGMETKTAEMANESAIAAWNKRVIDRDELLEVVESLEKPWPVENTRFDRPLEYVQLFEREMASRIRKAVGA